MTTHYYRIQTADRDPQDLISYARTAHWCSGQEQDGVSVCRSRQELAEYLAQSGIPFGAGKWVIVELTGDLLDATGHDGEDLVYPTEIISAEPLADEFFELVGAAYDSIYRTTT